MKFLIDGQKSRIDFRKLQWPDGIAGQLLTPLTGYKLASSVFAIDNGAFKRLESRKFSKLVARYRSRNPLFVAIPDKVGCHKTTLRMYEEYRILGLGCRRAFVAQDGFDGYPEDASAIFIGGTNAFKDSIEAIELVNAAKKQGMHVHVGRVNGPDRFWRFHDAGADTCDGSGVSRYDHMLPIIRDARL